MVEDENQSHYLAENIETYGALTSEEVRPS